MKVHSSIALLCLCVAASAAAEEEILPGAYPLTRYLAIWDNSPFNREVIKPVSQTIASSFAGSLVLEGIVNDDTIGPIAYVRDVREDKPLVITKQASEGHPFTIVSANQATNPEETKVTVTDGKETGEIGFVVAKLTQAIAAPAPAPPANQNRPGQSPPGRDQKGGAGGGGAGQLRPGIAPNTPNTSKPADVGKPTSVAPALDNLDSEPRRRRVPLPGG
ncbi:MAG: hypothetical protein KDN18_21525 [Verrucomicrobiae bacterium]|nr:hypothetical protein [Verrucomicrobiae bacterium]